MAIDLGRFSGGIIPGAEILGTKKALDPLGLVKGSPKKPKKTAQELAIERRQRLELNKTIQKQEDLFSLLSSRKLGSASFLSGSPRTSEEAAGGGGGGGKGLARSLLPGRSGTPRQPSTSVPRRFTASGRR